MTDLDPAIWENKTLGAANNLPFLDEVSAQITENRDAKAEGRKPKSFEQRGRFTHEGTNTHLVDIEGKPVDPTVATTELQKIIADSEDKVEREKIQAAKEQENYDKDKEDTLEEETKTNANAKKPSVTVKSTRSSRSDK